MEATTRRMYYAPEAGERDGEERETRFKEAVRKFVRKGGRVTDEALLALWRYTTGTMTATPIDPGTARRVLRLGTEAALTRKPHRSK